MREDDKMVLTFANDNNEERTKRTDACSTFLLSTVNSTPYELNNCGQQQFWVLRLIGEAGNASRR